MKRDERRTVLPQLAYGEGTMMVKENGVIIYKKYIHLQDGNIMQHFRSTDFRNPDDYVIAKKTGNNSNTKNIQNSLSLIFKNANINVEASNTHIMRHTCATLLYNNGVDLHSISMILGNSEEVLKKTYVHFEEEKLPSIMELIDDID